MRLIQVKLIEGVFDAAEKEAIIEKLTDAISVEGEAMQLPAALATPTPSALARRTSGGHRSPPHL